MNLDGMWIQLKQWMIGAARDVLYPLLDPLLPAWITPGRWLAFVSAVISVVAILAVVPLVMMYLTWAERKVVGRIQNRLGPNRVGWFGLLQPIADAVKMLTKEDIVPARGDRFVHLMAPLLILVPTLLVYAVIPFGDGMIAADLDIGVLYFIALSSVTTLAVFMGGWASRNKYSFLGAMRAVAQMVSYEVPLVIAAVVIVMRTGSLSTVKIVEAQSGLFGWFIFQPWGFFAFLVFLTAMTAEANRSPFDLPEGESELVAGFHTEYSGMKFGMFYLAEYFSALAQCFLAAALFLGGWNGPLLPGWAWMFLKTLALVFVLFLFRGAFPRIRVDQLMGFTWKFLLPLALADVFVAGLTFYMSPVLGWVTGAVLLTVTFVLLALPNQRAAQARRVCRLEN